MRENTLRMGLAQTENRTKTYNEMDAWSSSSNPLMDLFATMGASREKEEKEIEQIVLQSLSYDALLTLKAIFYARDIRGGLGERRFFRIALKTFASKMPSAAIKNFANVAEFGRWDDLYVFDGTLIEEEMYEFLKEQLKQDINNMLRGKPVSLLGKWLKSVNASSKESRRLGRKTARHFGMSEKEYRKTLSSLRSYIDIVEKKMSADEWENIEYSKVPSRAMNIYRNAFQEHDRYGFEQYLENVAAGTETIHASTLYPYDLVEKYVRELFWKTDIAPLDPVVEAQWQALPNYANTEDNILIMADTSGSMRGRPFATSVGLAIYFAERNRGIFHNSFMTFDQNPRFVELKGQTLRDKIESVPVIHANTDIEKAFELLLSAANLNEVPQEDMPSTIVIISDMQFDQATYAWEDINWDFYSSIKQRFAYDGYTIPNIVFWNVNATHSVFHALSDYEGVQLASGQSPAVFTQVMDSLGLTPYESMIKVLSRERYNSVTLAS